MKTKAKQAHTQGPWTVKQVSTGDCLLIIRDGLDNDSPDFSLTTAMNRRGPDYITKVALPARDRYDEKLETTEAANALLIASAPDLLAALMKYEKSFDKAHKVLSCGGTNVEILKAFDLASDTALAAIAAAKGEAR